MEAQGIWHYGTGTAAWKIKTYSHRNAPGNPQTVKDTSL